MIKIISKRRYEQMAMYQEAWLKENSRANRISMENVNLKAQIEELEKVCISQKEELECANKEICTLKSIKNVQDDEIKALKEEIEVLQQKISVSWGVVEAKNENISLSAQLKSYRKQNKLTRKQLGKKLGVSADSIRKWEGGRLPSKDNIDKINKLLAEDK